MQKASLGKFVIFLLDAFVKINLVKQIETVKYLLTDLPRLKKKVPVISLFLGLWIGGLVISWGLLMVIGVLALHNNLSLSWLHAFISIFLVNISLLGLITMGLTRSIENLKLGETPIPAKIPAKL